MRFDTWAEFLDYQRRQPYMREISEAVQHDRLLGAVYPRPEDVFRFTETPLAEVKVVILGQDPYHGLGQAHGLAFSYLGKGELFGDQVNSRRGPRSLYNIFRELQSDLGSNIVKHHTDFETKEQYIHGDLTPWTRQGVLLLNTALTVREGEAGSHCDIWQPFTDEVIRAVCDSATMAPHFILWGAKAKAALMRACDRRLLINLPDDNGITFTTLRSRRMSFTHSAHPSPLSADKGFFGSRPFSRANLALTLNNPGCAPVDWRLS